MKNKHETYIGFWTHIRHPKSRTPHSRPFWVSSVDSQHKGPVMCNREIFSVANQERLLRNSRVNDYLRRQDANVTSLWRHLAYPQSASPCTLSIELVKLMTSSSKASWAVQAGLETLLIFSEAEFRHVWTSSNSERGVKSCYVGGTLRPGAYFTNMDEL